MQPVAVQQPGVQPARSAAVPSSAVASRRGR